MKRLAAELFVIVTGILVALGVDQWRQDREEIRVVEEHLTDIAAELRRRAMHGSLTSCRPDCGWQVSTKGGRCCLRRSTGSRAPALEDDGDLVQAVERIRGRRIELLDLARNEAAVTTAKWYALQRLKRDYEANLAKLEPWDRDGTPLTELYEACKEGVGRPTPAPTK